MGNDTSAAANQRRNQGNQRRNQGNQGRNQGAKNQGKNQGKKQGKKQGAQNNEGRNQGNQGRNQGDQGRGSAPITNINQSQVPLTAGNPNQEAVPYNEGQMANQEISNVMTGIAGVGTPVNPEAAAMANNIRMNNGVGAGVGIGRTRQAYFDAYRRANKRAKSVKLVNLSCLQKKWDKYNTDSWGFDIPVAPVNAALRSCVYKYQAGKPGKYDNLIGMRPPTKQSQYINTGIVGPQQSLPVTVDTPTNIPVVQPPMPITEQQQVIIPEETSVVVETVQVPVPVPVPVAEPSVEAELVEKFIVGVDSNNQTMRYLMWITLVLLAIIIIGFIYKTQKEK